jgi:Fur family peroxide stress response transcriptional regulator
MPKPPSRRDPERRSRPGTLDGARVAAFAALCRERGLPLTVQRRAVLEALAARHDHPSADTLYEDLRERLPGLSRTTVYRVLDTLVALGAASRVAHPSGTVRFDPRTERHHHLVCAACGAIRDLDAARVGSLRMPVPAPEGFEIQDYSIHFRGLCAACAGRSRKPSAAQRGRRVSLRATKRTGKEKTT